ncbi:hypothetical protein [Embleya sp. NPDC001921]
MALAILATLFGGESDDLRVLWECAQGDVDSSTRRADLAAWRLRTCLRGLYLARSCPDLGELCARSDVTVPAGTVADVLAGGLVPDRGTAMMLAAALGGTAEIGILREEAGRALSGVGRPIPVGGLRCGTTAYRGHPKPGDPRTAGVRAQEGQPPRS